MCVVNFPSVRQRPSGYWLGQGTMSCVERYVYVVGQREGFQVAGANLYTEGSGQHKWKYVIFLFSSFLGGWRISYSWVTRNQHSNTHR